MTFEAASSREGNLPALTVAIPVYNDRENLKQTLMSISRLTNFMTGRIKVLIQDNDSDDKSYEVGTNFARSHGSGVSVERNDTNLGFHGNLRQLAARCETDFIWFIGAGECIIPDNISPLVDFLSSSAAQDMKMGVFLATSDSKQSNRQTTSDDWIIKVSEAGESQCFSETISLNLIRTELAREVLEASAGVSRIERDSWPHLEMALRAANSKSFQVISPPLISISANPDGWWYHSLIGMKIFLRQIYLLRESVINNKSSKWIEDLLKKQTGWHFAAMAFEMCLNGKKYNKQDLESARKLGVSHLPLLAARFIVTLPTWTLRAAQRLAQSIPR